MARKAKSQPAPLSQVELAALRLYDIAQGAAGGQQVHGDASGCLDLKQWIRYCAAVAQAFQVKLEIDDLVHFTGSFDDTATFLVEVAD